MYRNVKKFITSIVCEGDALVRRQDVVTPRRRRLLVMMRRRGNAVVAGDDLPVQIS